MKYIVKNISIRLFSLLTNPKFWILIILISIISLLYYSRNLNIGNGFPWFDSIRLIEIAYSIHGSMFTIPLILGAVFFGWRTAAIVWIISLAIILPRIMMLSYGFAPLMRNLFSAIVPLVFVILFALELNWREKERQYLKAQEKERRAYTEQIIKAQEDQRLKIARELHDDFLQSMLVIANGAQKVITHGYYDGKEQLNYIRDEAMRLCGEIRKLALDLRPGILDNRGLISALRWMADKFNQESNINVKLDYDEQPLQFKHETEVMIFRIVQEALNNVRRHSQATMVIISLKMHNEFLKISIQDNGRGFTVPASMNQYTSNGKLGLAGMNERTITIGGYMEINSVRGKGTTIAITVPRDNAIS
jgi:signal transduction histidine kinase